MPNLTLLTSTLVLAILLTPTLTLAQSLTYTPLIGVPGLDTDTSFNNFINSLYWLSISIAALLAVIKIIIAGVKLMLTDVVTTKGEAKKDIQGALIGLLVVLGAVLILTVINPQLTTVGFNPAPITNPDPAPATPRASSLLATMQPGDRTIDNITAASIAYAPPELVIDELKYQWVCENVVEERCPYGNGRLITGRITAGDSEAFCYEGEWDFTNQACLVRGENMVLTGSAAAGEVNFGGGGATTVGGGGGVGSVGGDIAFCDSGFYPVFVREPGSLTCVAAIDTGFTDQSDYCSSLDNSEQWCW